MPDDEKKQPESKDEEPKADEKEKTKRDDLIIDTTGEHPPGWAISM